MEQKHKVTSMAGRVMVFLTVSGVGGEGGGPAMTRPTSARMEKMHAESFMWENKGGGLSISAFIGQFGADTFSTSC